MRIIDAKIDLHVHPFFEQGNSLTDVVKAMQRTGIDIVGLERFNGQLFQQVCEQAQGLFYPQIPDDAGVILGGGVLQSKENRVVIFNAREYDTRERIHLLTIGWSDSSATPDTEMRRVIDTALKHGALVILDHPFVDNEFTRTAGHISDQKAQLLERICEEYIGEIAVEWNGYCVPWMRAALQPVVKALYAARIVPHDCTYHDVNKKAEEFVEQMRAKGYNIPLIADTDLHARNPGLLNAIGTAYVTATVEGERASEILASMKRAIFRGAYQNHEEYVSGLHLLRAFCLPVLFPAIYAKPRA